MCSENLAESLVEEVGCRVVVLDVESSLRIHMEAEALCAVSRNALCYMDREVVLLYSVYDVDLLAALRKDVTGIAYLTSHLGIEWGALEYELEHGLVLRLYCTVTCKLDSLDLCKVITYELDVVAVYELNPVARLYGSCITCSVLLLLELCLEALQVDLISLLRSDELRKVDRESPEYLLSFERCPFHTETPDHYALVSYLLDL